MDLYSSVLDSLASQIAVINRDGIISYVNKSWCDFAVANGAPPDYVWIGTNYLDVCGSSGRGDEGEAAANGIREVVSGQRAQFSLEYPCHSPAVKRWFLMVVTPVSAWPDHFVICHSDITDRHLAEDRLHLANFELGLLASTDRLTQLANRARLEEFLETESHRADRHNLELSVVLLDVDMFKSINDRFGHPVGDRVLVAIAQELKANIRTLDLAGRWGGEEFLIVTPDCSLTSAADLAERIRVRIATIKIDGVDRCTCSFGVANYANCGSSVEAMVRSADEALYAAKRMGRNRVEFLVH